MALHTQVWIEHDGVGAHVDEGIAPLILAVWRRGIRTISSCENQPDTGMAFVGFPTPHDATTFVALLGGGLRIILPNRADAEAVGEPYDPRVRVVALQPEDILNATARAEGHPAELTYRFPNRAERRAQQRVSGA